MCVEGTVANSEQRLSEVDCFSCFFSAMALWHKKGTTQVMDAPLAQEAEWEHAQSPT